MEIIPLPHVYPFRFVDGVLEERDTTFSRGRVSMAISANARAVSGERWSSPFLLAEAIAQSALLLHGGDPEIGKSGYLAGIDNFSADRVPEPGENLSIDVSLEGQFGLMAKFRGSVSAGGMEIARGEIIVRQGDRRP